MEKLIVFVPHQDDEINLVGNILFELVKKYEVYIVYSSLEIDKSKAEIRKRESFKACKIYGINKEHIIFLGYPDTFNKTGHHFFTDGNSFIINDFKNIIESLYPQIIIGTDFDFHSDHRMLSLALDEAMRNVLLENKNYHPKYLKGFCYETAYYGIEDYSASALEQTKVKSNLLGNVSYRWEDRISIKSHERNGFILFKKAYKALKCYSSQCAVLHARSIINADNIFWEKRTDNLMLFAKIYSNNNLVPSLNDFMVIDTNDIITIDQKLINYSKGVWQSKGKSTEIIIKWPQKVRIDRLVFHGNPNLAIKKELCVCVNNEQGNKICEINSINEYGRATQIIFDAVECDTLKIICESRDKIIELSEIEAYLGDSLLVLQSTFIDNKVYKTNKLIDYFDQLIFKTVVLKTKVKRKIFSLMK